MIFGAQKFTEIGIIPKQALASIYEVLKTPRLIISILPQYAVGLASGFLIYQIVIAAIEPALIDLITLDLSNWPGFLATSTNWILGKVASGLSILLAGVSSIIGAYIAIISLAGFFVELFIEQALKIRKLEILHTPSFFGGILRLVRDEFSKVLLMLSLGLVAFISAFIPILTPLSFILTSLIIGFELFDQPLILIGYQLKERLKIFRSHLPVIIVFGGLFSFTAIIPFLPILLLPIALLTTLRISLGWNLPIIKSETN